jgi:dGTPase
MSMTWSRLLAERRLGESEKPQRPRTPGRTPFQADVDRIVFSSAFRRLQDKTQVHPLADNDYVRKRLTHSIEVASVGRSLATEVGARVMAEQIELADAGLGPADFGYVVQAACLAHDIGNPPFGHGGEDAIRDWFANNTAILGDLSTRQKRDLQAFEGNAQGFRQLARLEMRRDAGGLRLTYATLGAFMKYPRAADGVADGYIGAKKQGFTDAEAPAFSEVAAALGLLPRGPLAWARHPLAFLMEAADDITYGVIDVEDGFQAGFLAVEEAEQALGGLLDGGVPGWMRALDAEGRIQALRAAAIGTLIDACVAAFMNNQAAILDGSFNASLVQASTQSAAYAALTALARRRVFDDRRVVGREVAGFAALRGMMDAFAGEWVPALARVDFNPDKLRGAPRRLHLLLGAPAPADRYTALLTVTDFVSALSDRAAMTLYQQLRGIAL